MLLIEICTSCADDTITFTVGEGRFAAVGAEAVLSAAIAVISTFDAPVVAVVLADTAQDATACSIQDSGRFTPFAALSRTALKAVCRTAVTGSYMLGEVRAWITSFAGASALRYHKHGRRKAFFAVIRTITSFAISSALNAFPISEKGSLLTGRAAATPITHMPSVASEAETLLVALGTPIRTSDTLASKRVLNFAFHALFSYTFTRI